ncbi:acetylglutamate kinase [Micromonospora sp. NPDC051141]|uniref:amino acid kinase family protein n=1 Tax=Micromonospora sp. NPDC051141 TaxID=3364284 RepID=UPI0037B69B94
MARHAAGSPAALSHLCRDGVIVVKVGGDVDSAPVLDEVTELVAAGRPTVLVHGGGIAADELADQLGVAREVITSPDGTRSRRTTPAMLTVLTLALLGRVKPELLSGLRARGVRGVGLCGADGALITASRKPVIRSVRDGRTVLIRDDRSGRIEHIDPTLVRLVLEHDVVPVVSPPVSDAEGNLLNADADGVAAGLAEALDASALVLLTRVCGVLADLDEPSSRLREVGPHHLAGDLVRGRMRHKVRAALRASRTVGRVAIGGGNHHRPIRHALSGGGTWVCEGSVA